MSSLTSLILAFILTIVLLPISIKVSKIIDFTDKPTKRKRHTGLIPLCGGIVIFTVYFIGYFVSFKDYYFDEKLGIFIGAILIVSIGIVDDYYKSKSKEFGILPRLIVHIIAATIAFKSGVTFNGFTNPITGVYITLPYILQYILTITWIFGITTVINWSDGMDGLAGGLSLIAAITFAVASIILNQPPSLMLSTILIGVLIGFLLFNKYPAKVYMGDSGANFLGYILSIIALIGAFKQATIMSLMIPLFSLAIPIFDNIFVVLKRFIDGKPIYLADRSQIHYRLQEKGLSNKEIIVYLCLVSIGFSIISIILLFL